ncbi:MAG TPA: metal ABC transporter ATP-binding protein [Dehalococcoidia bacterium]|nr:metal ABC transporter ATP-binding protein [Dehalococcoidia bacterium]
MPAEEIVILRNVNVSYGDIKALEDVNLSVCEHDFLGIIGPNGGGKSTLLKVMLGLVQPQAGTVVVMGKAPSMVRNRIGYVSQRFSFDRDFPVSVLDVVIMGHYGRRGLVRRYTKEDRQSAAAALEQVGMLESRHKQIGKLSGGQQQRVFIARALVAKPELLLLDEPTANIDSTMQMGIYEMLRDLKQRLTIIMVSHDIGAVSIYVDKIACLNQQLYYHGSREITAEILEATYKCPVQLITHGTVPHRVLKEH